MEHLAGQRMIEIKGRRGFFDGGDHALQFLTLRSDSGHLRADLPAVIGQMIQGHLNKRVLGYLAIAFLGLDADL